MLNSETLLTSKDSGTVGIAITCPIASDSLLFFYTKCCICVMSSSSKFG